MEKVILTFTPNPALDLSGVVKNLKPNEKAYVYNEQRAPGGNSINSARVLSRLDIPVLASGFLGGSTGKEIALLLKHENLKAHFIDIKESTRINVTVSNHQDHQQTRLSFPGPHIHKNEKQQLFELVSKRNDIALLLIGGSLPSGFNPQDISRLMRLAKKKEALCIVDCPGDILAQVLSEKPLLIKPNLEEFHILTKSRVTTLAAVRKKAEGLLSKVSYVCVSSVEGGALLVTREGSYFGKIPRIKIRSTVGAGDSMVGAMAAQLYLGSTSPEEILRWGLAASAATLGEKGTTLGRASEVRRLFRKIQIQKLG